MTDISRISGGTPATPAKTQENLPVSEKETLPAIKDRATISKKIDKPTTGEKIGGYVMGTLTAGAAGAFRGARGSVEGAVDGVRQGHKTGSKIIKNYDGVATTMQRVLAASAGLCLAAAGASMIGPPGAVAGFIAGAAIGASLPTFAGAAVGSMKGFVKGAADGVQDGWKAGNRFGQEFVHYIKDAFHVGK